jgi:hypothetical protein
MDGPRLGEMDFLFNLLAKAQPVSTLRHNNPVLYLI